MTVEFQRTAPRRLRGARLANGREIPTIGWRRLQRIYKRIDRSNPEGCWPWTGTISPSGYGYLQFTFNQTTFSVNAHRLVYQMLIGDIAEGLELDHLCRNPRCVNPTHLEPVTASVNADRKMAANRSGKFATHCKHGHEFNEANTYYRSDRTGRDCRTCKATALRRFRARHHT